MTISGLSPNDKVFNKMLMVSASGTAAAIS